MKKAVVILIAVLLLVGFFIPGFWEQHFFFNMQMMPHAWSFSTGGWPLTLLTIFTLAVVSLLMMVVAASIALLLLAIAAVCFTAFAAPFFLPVVLLVLIIWCISRIFRQPASC